MTPLPVSLGGHGAIYGWRLDREARAADWNSGVGAAKSGGRWNNVGVEAVYASLDPATAIVEVAVHKGFHALDTEPHILTWFEILNPADVFVVQGTDVPNGNWLRPGIPGKGQRDYGDTLLAAHKFVLIPSAVSSHSWNVIFSPRKAAGAYVFRSAEPFALDTRLNPPSP